MKIYGRLILLMVSIFITNSLIAQKGSYNSQGYTVEQLKSKSLSGQFAELEGTFQVLIHGEESSVLITEELLNFISNERRESEDVTLSFNSNISLYIPSRQRVLSSSYTKLNLIQD